MAWVQKSLFGEGKGELLSVYSQTKGAKGLAKVLEVSENGEKLGHITLHADGTLNKHGICSKLSDSDARKLVNKAS